MRYRDESTGFPLRGEALHIHYLSRSLQFPPPSSVLRNMRHADNLRSTCQMTRFATPGKSYKADRVNSYNPERTEVFQACRFSTEPESPIDGSPQICVVSLQKT